jgi:hypothetical protein
LRFGWLGDFCEVRCRVLVGGALHILAGGFTALQIGARYTLLQNPRVLFLALGGSAVAPTG